MSKTWRGRRAYKGNRIEKDNVGITTSQTVERLRIPLIDSTDLPPPYRPGIGGGLAYDIFSERVYYSDGFGWFPISSGGGGGGNVESYSFIKDTSQSIPSSTETTLTNYTTTPSPTYHTISGWNLTTGIYTATQNEFLSLFVNISWEGVSNLGERVLRVQVNGTTVKEVDTQADPQSSIETTQECQINLQLSVGDAVRVAVFHGAPANVPVVGGNHTSVSGYRIRT